MNVAALAHADAAALLAPITSRIRRSDHWAVFRDAAPHRRKAPLSDVVLYQHVKGVFRVGACPMEHGAEVTRLAVIDLDSHGGQTDWSSMVALARRMTETADMLAGIRLVPFRSSGGHGIHLFALWEDHQDAHSVREAMREVLAGVDLRIGASKKGVAGGVAEVFPKQSHVPFDGVGSMFVLPGGGGTQSQPIDRTTWAFLDWRDVEWPVSDPVTVVARPEVPAASEPTSEDMRRLASALWELSPDAYEYGGEEGQIGWLELLFAVHSGSDGSAEGLDLFRDWSRRWKGHTGEPSDAETIKQWRAAKPRAGGVTAATLFAEARRQGWIDPNEPAADESGFEVMAVEPGRMSHRDVITHGEGTPFVIDRVIRGEKTPSSVSSVLPLMDRILGDRICYDDFSAEMMLRWGDELRPYTDDDTTALMILLERYCGIKKAQDTVVTRVASFLAAQNRIDTGRAWLESLPYWDGVARVERFCANYLGATDEPAYSDAVGQYLWSALAGRMMSPGCKVDMVVVLVGAQGTRKSTSVAAMAPDDFVTEVVLSANDADTIRLVRGKILAEVPELSGLSARDHESMKAFITRQTDSWVPKYKEHEVRMPRRCVFIGTSNESTGFLTDRTGNRRWLPLTVRQCDPDAIARDMPQLWAEGLALWKDFGVRWEAAERLAALSGGPVDRHTLSVDDPWCDTVHAYMRASGPDDVVTTAQVLEFALNIRPKDQGVREQRRLGRVMKEVGCEPSRLTQDGRRIRGWVYAPKEDA